MNVKGCCFFDPMNWNIAVLDYFPLQIKCWYQSSLYITSASPLNSFMKRWRSHSILDMILYGTETLGFDMCCICVSILSLIDGYFGTQLLSPEWPKYQVDVSIWILNYWSTFTVNFSKMYVNVIIDTLQKKLWKDDLPSFWGKKNLEIHSQNRGGTFLTVTNWGASPSVDRVIHWQYLGDGPNLGDIIVLGPGSIIVSGFWNLRSFLVGGFSWVEIPPFLFGNCTVWSC